jgi:hypothetical protein
LAGTVGALSSTGLILRFGNNYSFLFTAPFFTLAGLFWLLIEIAEGKKSDVFADRMWYIRVRRLRKFSYDRPSEMELRCWANRFTTARNLYLGDANLFGFGHVTLLAYMHIGTFHCFCLTQISGNSNCTGSRYTNISSLGVHANTGRNVEAWSRVRDRGYIHVEDY